MKGGDIILFSDYVDITLIVLFLFVFIGWRNK